MDPSQKSEIDKLKSRVKKLEESPRYVPITQESASIANPVTEKRSINWSLLQGVFVTALALLSFGGGVVWVGHVELKGIYDRMSNMDKRLARFETAIKIIAEKQGGDTKELINDALTVARLNLDAGDVDHARSALSIANKLIAQQRSAKVPRGAEFFQLAASSYSAAWAHATRDERIMDEAFRGSAQLAEYRSALENTKNLVGTKFNCSPGSGESPVIFPMGDLSTASRLVNGVTLIGCPVLLDGITWRNVVFINSRVSYNGGAVILENVTFVNCTFDAKRNPNTQKFLQYAALRESSFKVYPLFFASVARGS